MNREEAIAQARIAAEAQGFTLSDIVFANRFRFWPWRPVWRVSFRFPGEDVTRAGLILVTVREQPGSTTVHRLRPWSDFSPERLTLSLLALSAISGVTAMIVLQVLRSFFQIPVGPFLQGMITGPSLLLPFMLLFLFRLLGKDAWLLRREARQRL